MIPPQPSALDPQHGILVHKFLDDDAGPLQQGSGLLLLLRTSDDLRPQQVALGPELRIALIYLPDDVGMLGNAVISKTFLRTRKVMVIVTPQM